MNKIKILHLITRSAFGGSQDNTFCTCEGHDRERYEVHLACNPNGEWADRARRAAWRAAVGRDVAYRDRRSGVWVYRSGCGGAWV